MNEITCREFDQAVHGFVRMELLDMSMRDAVIEHAAHCNHCAQRMREAGVLAEVNAAAAESARELQAPPEIEAALLSAFRNRRVRRHAALWRTFEWAAAGTAAAVLALLLWTSSNRSKNQPSPAPKRDVSSQSKQPLDAQGPASSQTEQAPQANEYEASQEGSADALAMADFVPVPFTEAMAPEDPGMVVRVQMTRGSLAELGYPVAEAPDEDLIRADVLVGQDGWPRAVRLVQ
jgi:hypothetical protein